MAEFELREYSKYLQNNRNLQVHTSELKDKVKEVVT